MASFTYRDDGDVPVHGSGYRHSRIDEDVPVLGSGYWHSRIDEDVPVRGSGYRHSRIDEDVPVRGSGYQHPQIDGDIPVRGSGYRHPQIDGDIPVRGSGYRHSPTDDDVPAAYSVRHTYEEVMDLPPNTMPTSSSQHIPRKHHPRPVSRHQGENGSKTSVATNHSKRTSKVVQADNKPVESESIWTPFGTLGGKKKKSKR